MSDWRQVTLGEVADVAVGFAFKSSMFTDDPEDVRLLRGVNIGQGILNWERCAKWPRNYAVDKRYHLAAGDVVLAMDRPWIEAGLKRARLQQRDLPSVLVQRVARLRGTRMTRTSFIHHVIASEPFSRYLQAIVTGATVPHISQSQIEAFELAVPPLKDQDAICGVLDSIDELIDNTRRRIEVLEELARTIYREWFVHFRYPGAGDDSLVDSSLGLIPAGWTIKPVAAFALREKNAVTGGPFGSKLGRSDYVSHGVPVIRGGNLRVGGGFDEDNFVFISPRKAEELRSSTARRNDVVITQRGTLGQIGLIPSSSAFDRYVLSQSQMKITVDPLLSSPEFIYSQLRTPETTARFIAQAMSSGVPHVNLKLLRDFELVAPPIRIQAEFTEQVAALNDQAWVLRRQARCSSAMRDLLLPKLISGRIDVSTLDLDVLLQESVA